MTHTDPVSKKKMLALGLLGFLLGFPTPVLAYTFLI
jgi:hypothetical protein